MSGALGEVRVDVGVNMSPLDRGFAKARTKTQQFDRTVSKATKGGTVAMGRLGVSAQKAGVEISRLGGGTAANLTRLAANSNAAATAVTGLGRAANIAAIGGIAAAGAGILALGVAITKGLSAFAPFEQAMRNVATVSGATANEFDQLSKAALDAAAATRFNPQQTADALYALASAGQTVTQQIATLPNVLNFAEAAQANLGQATEIVTSTLNVFSMSAQESARVADVFTAAIGNSALNASRIEVAMRNAAPTAAALGQSFEQTTAALGLLTSAFGNGERAGTGMRAILTEMGDKAGAFGIKVKNSAGEFRPFVDILKDFEKKGVTSTQIIEQFGAEAGPALAALLNQGSGALEKMEARLASSGQAAETAGKQLDTLRGDLDSMNSAWDALWVNFGDSVDGPARDAIQSITGVIRSARDGLADLNEAIETSADYWQAFQDIADFEFPDLGGDAAFEALAPIRESIASDLVAIANFFQLMVNTAADAMNTIIGVFVGGYDVAVGAWGMLPTAFGDLGVQAANALISAISSAVEYVVSGINTIIDAINSVGGSIGNVSFSGFSQLENTFKGSADAAADFASKTMDAALSVDYMGKATTTVTKPVVDFLNSVDASAKAMKNSRDEAKAWSVPVETANDNLKDATRSTTRFSDALIKNNKATKGAGGGQSELNKSLEDYRSIVQRVAEQEMPWLQAAREADELREALNALIAAGENLPEEYVVAVRAKIEKLDKQVANKTGAETGEEFGNAFSSGFGDIFKDIFEGGIDSLDDFLDKVTSKFAGLAYDNIDKLFSGEAFASSGSALGPDPIAAIGSQVGAAAQGGGFLGGATGASAAIGGGATGAMGSIGSIAGGALGSFSLGYQSGSPVMGALGGALSGFSAGLAFSPIGGLIGAVAGGALGFLGGILGGNSEKKKKRRAAQKELNGERGAIDQFLQISNGRGLGDFRSDFDDYSDDSLKYQWLARDAGDYDLQSALEEAHSNYFRLLEKTFRKESAVAIENLNAGFGFDTAFFDASDNMADARDELTGWVDDARYMFDKLREFNNGLDQNEVDTKISEMEHAAQRYAISLVTGVEPMSDVAERINEIKGASVGLEETLVRLAMSAEDAAAAVDDALLTAMDNLREEFFEGITESINELNGKGYINALSDAVEGLSEKMADAALLGVSGARSLEEFDLLIGQITSNAADALPATERAEVYQEALRAVAGASGDASGVIGGLLNNALGDLAEAAAEAADALISAADGMFLGIRGSISQNMGIGFFGEIEAAMSTYQDRLAVSSELGIDATGAMSELSFAIKAISSSSALTTDQLAALAAVFPSISDTLMGIVGAGSDADLADAQAAVDRAKADLRASYQAEVAEIESTISSLAAFISRIEIFKDSLKLDNTLSPLSPLDRLNEAKSIYDESLAGVASGDVEALGRLEQVSRDYLTEARSYHGSSEEYFQIFESVDAALQTALNNAGTQITAAEAQLVELKTQVGGLIDINDSVMSVEDAILGVDAAISALAVAQVAQVQAIYDLAAVRDNQQAAEINSLYQSLLGRDADQSGSAGWQQSLQSGGSIGDVAAGISGSTEAAIRNLYLSILGREPDAAGLTGWANYLRGGGTLAGVSEGIINSPEAAALGITPMADGGTVTGGTPGRDSVPILAMPGEFVMPTMQARNYGAELAAMRAGTFANNDNASVLSELRLLRAEVASLTGVTAAGAQAGVAATKGVSSAIRDQSRLADMVRNTGR